MYLHKEGRSIITGSSIILLGLSYLAYMYIDSMAIKILAITFCLVFLYLIIQFFRNPTRKIAHYDANKVYAPADGKVVVIEETEEVEYFHDKRIQISIFMSPLNVHSNKAPVPGTVAYYKYHAGKFLVAWHPKSSTENERSTVVFNNGKIDILVRQIAGAVARRIKPYVTVGQKFQQGEEFGFIKFGSRVDIFLPIGTKILVDKEQKVRANVDVIAELE